MIIKSRGHKYIGSIRKLVYYILDHKKTNQEAFFLSRFITGEKTAESAIAQLEANERKRIIKRRKNSVVTYHDIISFEARDSKKLNEVMLKKMVRQYAKLRGGKSIVVSALHFDQQHIHLHILLSACQIDGTSARLSREEFKNCKLEMEAWQNKHLKLEYSKINHDAKKKSVSTTVNIESTNGESKAIEKN